jgi:hypothetical protein
MHAIIGGPCELFPRMAVSCVIAAIFAELAERCQRRLGSSASSEWADYNGTSLIAQRAP